MLEVQGLSVSYGPVKAVRDVSFTLGRGEILALVGPNGAGKSTTLMTIAGEKRAAMRRGRVRVEGSIRLQGKELIGLHPDQIVRAGLALVPEQRRIFGPLTVEDNIRVASAVRRDKAAVRAETAAVFDLFPALARARHRRAGLLSGGQQQQLAIARSLLTGAEVLLLDEPSLGLAPIVVEELMALIASLADGERSVLLVEQSALQALDISSRAMLLRNGSLSEIDNAQDGQQMLAAYFGIDASSVLRLQIGSDMHVQYLIDAVTVGGLYALLAVGLAMTFGVARLVNLAQGELIMVSAFTIYLISPDLWYVAIPAAVVVSVLFALLMSWMPFSFLRGADETTLLVASFGVSLAMQGLAVAIFGSRPKGTGFGSGVSASIEVLGLSVSLLDLITFVVVIVMLVLLTAFLRWTAAGVWVRAAADDYVMAQLLGVRAHRVVRAAFVISGVIAALTGILLTARNGTVFPEMGVQPLLLGLVAVVLGGLRSLPGAAAGGFILGGLTVALTVLLPPAIAVYRDAILFVIVILVLLVRPGGIFVKSSALERV